MEQVHDLPAGYQTLEGERDVRLSDGQRQRIGNVCVLYHNPEMLFFAVATSALYAVTEQAVIGAIEALTHQK
jgi:ABC-type multidrug transport system fused ATPase/permease subunit